MTIFSPLFSMQVESDNEQRNYRLLGSIDWTKELCPAGHPQGIFTATGEVFKGNNSNLNKDDMHQVADEGCDLSFLESHKYDKSLKNKRRNSELDDSSSLNTHLDGANSLPQRWNVEKKIKSDSNIGRDIESGSCLIGTEKNIENSIEDMSPPPLEQYNSEENTESEEITESYMNIESEENTESEDNRE